MEDIYFNIRKRAREVVNSFPKPLFYEDFKIEVEVSKNFFYSDPVIVKLKNEVSKRIENDFGHGMDHSTKVALDAGALILIEGKKKGYSKVFSLHNLMLIQCAGLLHDIKRKKKNHAAVSATFSKVILKDFSFSKEDQDYIYNAIFNHEAFKKQIEIDSDIGKLISDCLYDADKFRWGPDNFTHTVWDMVSYSKIPVEKFVEHYPKGIKALSKICSSFRSETGKKYGPQFIDIGIEIGDKVFEIIKSDFLGNKNRP